MIFSANCAYAQSYVPDDKSKAQSSDGELDYGHLVLAEIYGNDPRFVKPAKLSAPSASVKARSSRSRITPDLAKPDVPKLVPAAKDKAEESAAAAYTAAQEVKAAAPSKAKLASKIMNLMDLTPDVDGIFTQSGPATEAFSGPESVATVPADRNEAAGTSHHAPEPAESVVWSSERAGASHASSGIKEIDPSEAFKDIPIGDPFG